MDKLKKNKIYNIVNISRLKKIADHDIANRDSAVIYIDGKFYEDVTHAACLKQFIDENNYDTKLNSIQYRPDIDKFQLISKEIGPVILGHIASKEEAVFLIYGVIDGEIIDFDNIPDKYKNIFSKHYKMDIADEMKHDIQIGDSNDPYKQDYYNNSEKATERLRELKSDNYSKVIKELKNKGYNKIKVDDSVYWTDGFIYIQFSDEESNGDIDEGEYTSVFITIPGDAKNESYCSIDEFDRIFNSLDFSCCDYLRSIGAVSFIDENDVVTFTFKNQNGHEIAVSCYYSCSLSLFSIDGDDSGDFIDSVNDTFEDYLDLSVKDLQFLYNMQ